MKTYLRTVTYEIRAESLTQAHDMWEGDGPECGADVRVAASSDLEEHTAAYAPHGDPEFMPNPTPEV